MNELKNETKMRFLTMPCINSLIVHFQNVVSLVNTVKMCFSDINRRGNKLKKIKFKDKNKSILFFSDITQAPMKKKRCGSTTDFLTRT